MAERWAEVKRKVGPSELINTGFREQGGGRISIPPLKKITKVIFSMRMKIIIVILEFGFTRPWGQGPWGGFDVGFGLSFEFW